MRRASAGAVALAVLSLLVLRQPSYDPTAWLIWGRELTHGTLSMIGGPSWKPLPVAFTTTFGLAGSGAAPLLWLLVARAGGFLAIVMMYRVTARIGGRTAGLVAAVGFALGTDYLFNVVRGDSEGMLVALVLLALDLHLSGRRHAALLAGIAAGLLRPEVWPLLAVYGLTLAHQRRGFLLAAAGAVALLAAWFVPDYLSTGDWLRGANRARHPVPGSPGQSSFPFGLTFVYASIFLPWPLYAGAIRTVVRRRDEPLVRQVALAAAGLMVTVALLAEVGFTGNIRYVTLPMALVCILGGLGLPELARALNGRWRLAAVPAAIAVVVSLGIVADGGRRLADDERDLGGRLDAAVAAAGGAAAVRACGRVATGRFERQTVAYRLRLPSRDVWTHAVTPGVALVRAGKVLPGAAAVPVRRRPAGWTVRSTCR